LRGTYVERDDMMSKIREYEQKLLKESDE
jgi:hypothetical protein